MPEMNTKAYARLRAFTVDLENLWGTRPRLVLACAGGSDEHWQFFHPEAPYAVACTLQIDGTGPEAHPDAPEWVKFP